MIYDIKVKTWIICAVLLLGACSCHRHQDATDKHVPVSFLPNTYIDSLYTAYTSSKGVKQISNANNLLTALYEDETTDSLIQFSTNDNMDAVDATVNYWMGEYFYSTSRYNEAEEIAKMALPKAQDLKDEALEMCINSLLSASCHRLSKNEEALTYLQKCYESSSKSGDLVAQSSDLNNMAAISQALGDPALAKSYIDKAIEIERQLGRSNVLAIRYGIASEIYQSLGILDTAEKFALDAYALDHNDGREGKAAVRLSQLAAVLIAKGEKDKAIEILHQAEPALTANGIVYSYAVVENQLGSLYLERGQNAVAAQHFTQAYTASKDGGFLYLLQRALDGLANSLHDIDINKAYDYLSQSTGVADSIYKLNNRKELAVIEQKYQESEALHASEQRAYERRIQTYILMIILAIAALVISVLFVNIRNKNKRQRIMKSLEKTRSNFFTNITHEFRTPITVIIGMSDDITQDAEASPKVKEAADVITAQSKGLLDLVNQLLDISKVQSEIGTPDWRHGNVVSYMHMIAEKYVHTASHRGVDLVFSPSENVIMMDFIPRYIHKIIHNLISNSLKFTPKGGRIYISTNVNDNKLILRVADTGVGIGHADLSHIFEPYYQGENSNSVGMGTGIGLSLVNQMVKAMDGEITVKSANDKGTVFTISIPLTHAGTVKELEDTDPNVGYTTEEPQPDNIDNSDAQPAAIDDDSSGEKPIVLIVEDNPEVGAYIGKHLSDYNVQYARNGREGLAKAKELVPDVIVTDLMMPEMDGMEMTKQIREDALVSHVPVIVVTAKAEEADKIRALKMGIDAYLVKPFNHDELEVRVNQLIRQRRMLCEKYQRALSTGNIDNDDMPVADRQFVSNVTNVVYGMISKNETTDLEVVANKLNMTSRSLSRKLQAVTGDSPLLYINKIKISKAKRIIDSDANIALSDVAYQCGFETLSYFSRIFKQIEGVNPTAYRRRVK